MDNSIRYRNSALVNKAYKKLVIPDITSRLCSMIGVLVDSLIAARFIGIEAMSAIALVVPFTLFSSFLHDLLVSGTTPTLIKYKSRGQLKQADRAFAAIIINTLFWYLIVYGLFLIFAENLLRLFTQDDALIADGLEYFIPMILFEPFCELGLCFERGFKTDGRNGFFGVRGVLTSILNMVFNLIAVLVLHAGIRGISIASCAATFIGYCWSFSHFFTRNCTIRPDFSVIRNRAEMKEYLHEEINIGSVYALDDGLYAAASALLNKAFILTGGTPALTAVGTCSAVCSIILSVNMAVQTSSYSLCNLFYSDRDYRGATLSLRSAVIIEACFGAFIWSVLNVFSRQIGLLYKVDSPEVMAALRLCLCFSTLASVADSYTNLFSSFMLATDRANKARRFAIANNVMIFLSALIGMTGISFLALLCVNMVASVLVAAGEAVLLASSGKVLREKSETEIQTYSYTLNESACSEISKRIGDLLGSVPSLAEHAPKAALLAEECNRLILYTNGKSNKPIYVDLRISADETGCVITLTDTGKLFDPVNRLKEGELPEEFALSRQLLQGFSPKASYARVVDLNISHLILTPPEA